MLLHPPPILKEYLRKCDISYIQKFNAEHFRRDSSLLLFQSKWNKKMAPVNGLQYEFLCAELINKTKAQTLQSQIETTEKTIDKMVYELYGLSEEEIGIVENS